jgi:hypothetical protein
MSVSDSEKIRKEQRKGYYRSNTDTGKLQNVAQAGYLGIRCRMEGSVYLRSMKGTKGVCEKGRAYQPAGLIQQAWG